MSETSLPSVINVRESVDVLTKYESLVQSSLGANSVYIRTKETLDQLASDGDIKDADKARILAEVLTSLNTAIVNSSMDTALKWASTEKDIQLKKLELHRSLQILDEELSIKKANVKTAEAEVTRVKADTLASFGVTGLDANGNVVTSNVSVPQTSRVGSEIALNAERTRTEEQTVELTKNKIKESHVSINKVVADTVTSYGVFTYAIDNDPDSSTYGRLGAVSRGNAANMTYILSDIQSKIAGGQAKGYVYNAWANAVTASASTLGTLVASGSDNTALYEQYGELVVEGIGKLLLAAPPTGLPS